MLFFYSKGRGWSGRGGICLFFDVCSVVSVQSRSSRWELLLFWLLLRFFGFDVFAAVGVLIFFKSAPRDGPDRGRIIYGKAV